MIKQACMVEQRSEFREPAEGEVWFAPQGPGSLEFRGRLVDCSKSGFLK